MPKEEVSLTYAKQYTKRNQHKYCLKDNVFSAMSEYHLRKDEVQSLLDYAKKLFTYQFKDYSHVTVESIINY